MTGQTILNGLKPNSLNSLAVRVPHNSSNRVCEEQTPDRWVRTVVPLPGAGFNSKTNGFSTSSVARLVKPMVFQRFRLPGL